jgi:hypothetical protein
MFEVRHDPLNLHSKGLFRVKNTRQAQRILEGWLDTKHPDFRLRYIFDHKAGILELGARNLINMQGALNVLRDSGQKPKQISWVNKMMALMRGRGMEPRIKLYS